MGTEKIISYLDDHANPYLVKEARQLLASRTYPWFLIVLMLAMLGIVAFSFLDRRDINVKEYYMIILVGALYTSIIFGYIVSWRQGCEAKRDHSFLAAYQYPRQLIWGRAISIFVQNAMLLFPLLPFFAIAAILPGISAYQVMETIFLVIILQLPFMGAVLFLGTIRGGVKSILLIILCLPLAIIIPALIPNLLKSTANEPTHKMLILNLVMLLLAIKYFLIFFSFSALNTGLKVVMDRKITWMMIAGWGIAPIALLLSLPILYVMPTSMAKVIAESLATGLALAFVECGVSFLILFPVMAGIFARE
jgi:hypothetical protein